MDRHEIEQRITSEQQHREAAIRVVPRAKGEPEDAPRRFEVAISSEAEVERWFGIEILEHSKSAIDMTRAKRGLAVLVDHRGDQIGVVRNIRLDDDKVLRGDVQFSASARGREVEQDVRDGIREHVSVGYFIKQVKLVEQRSGGVDVYRVQRWQPAEVSFVSVPADLTVGVGRSQSSHKGVSVEREQVEQQDSAAIAEVCALHGMGHKAAEWIRAGHSADHVGRLILAEKARATSAQPAAEALDAVPEEDRRNFSYARAIKGALAEKEGTGKLDGREAAINQELERAWKGMPRHGGILVPLDLRTPEQRMHARTLDTKTLTKGSEVVNDTPGELIEMLRNKAAVTSLGARVLPGLVGNVVFTKQTGGLTIYWVGENTGVDLTESDVALALATLAPKTMGGSTSYSRQLLAQSSIDIESMIRDELALGHALAIDYGALHGIGASGEPLGIYPTPNVLSVAVGGAMTYAKALEMVGKVAAANAIRGQLGWLMHATMATGLMGEQLFPGTASGEPVWTGTYDEGRVAGYRAIASNQLSATMNGKARTGGTEIGTVFGNWNDLLLGLWGVMEIVVDPYTKKKQHLIEVATFQQADVLVRHPESFVVSTGATG